MTVDLAAANARYIATLPQSFMDATPTILAEIARAEKADPADGPFRVHRVPIWNPQKWLSTASDNRIRDFVVWERESIQPKYGITLGVHYTATLGVAEIYDYQWFFAPFLLHANPAAAAFLSINPGDQIVVSPRRGYDLWNSRYFVLPFLPRWNEEHRGFASFLDGTERVYPPADAFRGPGGKDREKDWALKHDWQIRRNLEVYPRAWVVHEARSVRPFDGLGREERALPMEEILYAGDRFWNYPKRVVYDPRQYVWISSLERANLGHFFPGGLATSTETARIVRYESDVVELDATLDRPGFVVLSEIDYPGWELTIDDHPSPIYRSNFRMRGAPVESGRHRLVYRYRPASFRIGLVISCAGLAALVLVGFWSSTRSRSFRS